jgi:AcrR family transcriptional regulator
VTVRRLPTQARGRATWDAVLDAASRLADVDPEQLSVAAIASAAGVGTGTLYQYFESVDDVVDAVVHRHLDRFRELIERTFADRTFADATEASLAVTDAFVDYYRTEPGFRRLWFAGGIGSRFRSLDQLSDRALARTMFDQLTGHGLVVRSREAEVISTANWELADALIGLAFRVDPDGDEATLVYVRHVMRQVCVAPPLDVIVEMIQRSTPPN